MTHPLDGAIAKIARAGQHFVELERQIGTFLDPKNNAYPVTTQVESDGSKHTFRLAHPKRAPVEDWGLLVGDIVHNLRASLDHIAWQLALKKSCTPSFGTEYPVFKSRDDYFAKNRRGGPWKIRCIDAAAQTVIEKTQPYNAPNPALSGLWVVHTLDITDKHQIIPVLASSQRAMKFTAYTGGHVMPTPPPGGLEIFSFMPLEHDAIMAILTLNPPDPKVEVKGEFAFTVIFGEKTIGINRTPEYPGVEVLTNLRTIIDAFPSIVNLFMPFF